MTTSTMRAEARRTLRPETPSDSSSSLAAYGGLCALCMRAPTCTFPRRADRPVWHCEEAELADAPTQTSHAAVQARTLRGLCVNCDNRHHCTLRRADGGVWRCEEYA